MTRIDYDGPGELHITGINEARTMDKSSFDRIITVCQDSIEDNISDKNKYSHYCMSDGPQNSYGGKHNYEIFESAAQELYYALESDEKVLIHCHAGQSRSVSVSTAALGRLLEINRHEALDMIRNYRNSANPNNLLLEHAEQYIKEYTGIDSTPIKEEYQ